LVEHKDIIIDVSSEKDPATSSKKDGEKNVTMAIPIVARDNSPGNCCTSSTPEETSHESASNY